MKEIILNLLKNKLNSYTVILKNKYPEIIDFLIKKYPKLKNHSIAEYCFWFLNDLNDFPKCKNCGKNLIKFRGITSGYLNYCSSKCAMSNPQTKILRNRTNLKKYGCEHPCQSKEVKEKIKKTNLKKYGMECSLQNKEVKDKTDKTNLKKYGVKYAIQNKNIFNKVKNTNLKKYGIECSLQNKEVKEKIKNTNLKRYGVDNPAKSDFVKEKIKQTNLRKYGVEFILQNKEVKEKIKKTNLEKYGVDNPLKSDLIKEKIKNTNLKKYGVENAGGSIGAIQKIKETTLKNHKVQFGVLTESAKKNSLKAKRENSFLKNIKTNFDEPMFDKKYFLKNYNRDLILKFKCKNCGNEFESKHRDGKHHKCPKCFKQNLISFTEKQLAKYLKQTFKIKENVRNIISPLELDIYIPDKKLAIEFDGLYWHSIRQKTDKNYHLKKTEACEKLGIQLIHIFENEWVLKQDIVKGYLNKLLDNFSKNISSDECEAKEIDLKITEEFLIKNYIFDFKISDINLGLYFNGELVSAIQIKKLNKENFELMSFCDKLNYKVNNSLKKLLNYFEQKFKPRQIISYVDRRWDNGKDLTNLNFQLKNVSEPNCLYFKGLNFIKENTENCHKIYDCGNLVFVKNYF